MRRVWKKRSALLIFFCSLLWAAEADPRDLEIQKDLDFFQTLEVLEAMPLLTEFGEVLDQISTEKSEVPQ